MMAASMCADFIRFLNAPRRAVVISFIIIRGILMVVYSSANITNFAIKRIIMCAAGAGTGFPALAVGCRRGGRRAHASEGPVAPEMI